MAESTRHLTGNCDGMRIERNGVVVRLVGRDGEVLRQVTCDSEAEARAETYVMAEDAYREADRADAVEDHRPRYSTKRMRDEIAKAKDYARREALEEAAKIAECHFDDRGNSRSGHPSEMDWTDGYREATQAAAAAIRAAIAKATHS